MKISKSVLVELLLSVALIAALFYFADVGKVLDVIGSINIWWLLVALAFYVAINLAMSLRIWALLQDMGVGIPYRKTLMAHFSGMIASDFTPARSGYLTTAVVLSRNNNVPLEKSMVSIIGPQIFDFMLKITAGAIAAWYLITFALGGVDESMVATIVFAIVAVLAMIGVMLLMLFSPRFANFITRFSFIPFADKIIKLVKQMQKNSASIRRLFWLITILLAFTWFFKAAEWYALSQAVGFSPDFPFHALIFFAFLQPISTVLQFAPLPTVAGAGFFEAGSIFVLMLFGVPLEQALVFSLLTRFIMIAVDSIGVREAVKTLMLGGKATQR